MTSMLHTKFLRSEYGSDVRIFNIQHFHGGGFGYVVDRIDYFSDGSTVSRETFHCEDGPAVLYRDGSREWLVYGKTHRIDGPAIMRKDQELSWCIDGKRYPDIHDWARAALIFQNKPADEDAVKSYAREVLNKLAMDEI